jgi:general secretion pathway protein G
MKSSGLLRATGFTLLELLVVLVILALLGSIVGPKVINYLGSSKSKTAKLQIQQFGESLELYKLEVGQYPNGQEGLAALMQAPSGATGWNGPYIKGANMLPKDPWGNEYHYASPGQHNKDFDISSLGADNRDGGDGENKDVNNWED